MTLDSSLLTPDAARALRADLKAALTEVVSGRHSVPVLLHQIERVAKYATGKPNVALGRPETKEAMATLVRTFAAYALDDSGLASMGWDNLYKKVKDERNDVMHTGTEAVLAEGHAKGLAVVLLDALLGAAKERGMTTLAEVMVEHPVCAHGWQTLADVRRSMLVSDFSVLPLVDGATSDDPPMWRVVTAEDLAAFLGTNDQRNRRMAKTVERAEECGLRVSVAATACEGTSVQEVWDRRACLPLMVIRERYHQRKGKSCDFEKDLHLVGIVTPFDLL